jgi:hypothetical protein
MMTNKADLGAAVIFVASGLFFGFQALALDMGTALRMGPGYFPLVLSAALILLGLVLGLRALRTTGAPLGTFAWRGAAFILAAPVLFALTIRGLGLVPAVFLTVVTAAFASRRMHIAEILLVAAALTVFATLVFSYGLGLPFRRFGPWLGF